jgi:carboxyl-terminal processing protease
MTVNAATMGSSKSVILVLAMLVVFNSGPTPCTSFQISSAFPFQKQTVFFAELGPKKTQNRRERHLDRHSTHIQLSLKRESEETTLSPSRDVTKIAKDVAQRLAKSAAFFTIAMTVLMSNGGIASASDYGSLSPEQKAVAEAWRSVDNSFNDRTFNGQDWFQLRQVAVKRKYKSIEEAQSEIKFMVDKLGDKYTRYLSPDKYQSMVDSATGTLAGVGVEITTTSDGDGTRVIAADVEENSPASRAGIQSNDVFVQVDGYTVPATATPDDVASRLRGPPGSKVGVLMERPSNGKTIDTVMTRDKITVTSVKSYMSEKPGIGKVGVIRIKSFSGTTSQKVTDMLTDLTKKGAKAFVLDLRRNPGGLLPGGVDTAGLFLDANQPVVFTISKSGT